MTTTTAPTDEQKLTILKHLASGKDAETVAAIVHRDVNDVVRIASTHGYPDTDKMQWAVDILARKTTPVIPERATTQGTPARTLGAARPITVSSTPSATSAAAPIGAPRPDEIRVLLNTAKSTEAKRIQALANRIFDDLDRLRGLLDEHQAKYAEREKAKREREAARAEVKRLEAQLRSARAALGHKVDGERVTPDGIPTAQVREWAREQGLDVPAVGRLPRAIHDAYENAHTDDATTTEKRTA